MSMSMSRFDVEVRGSSFEGEVRGSRFDGEVRGSRFDGEVRASTVDDEVRGARFDSAIRGARFDSAIRASGTRVAGKAGSPGEREERFLYLLRTYPEREARETLVQVEQLVQEGEFAEHDRAEYWLGSAWLALREREAARKWFARVGKDHPGSVWDERSWLGMADAAAQERQYGNALEWYAKGRTARDAAVREMARVSAQATRTLRARQRWAWAAGGVALAVAGLLAASLWRHRPVRLWPPPAEARIVLPVLAVLALLSVRQDPGPRAAILELCTGAALLVTLSGLRLRAASPRGTARALHAAGTLAALGSLAYVAVYRGDLVGMLLETLRAGPG